MRGMPREAASNPQRRSGDTSVPAIVATVALVGFSVFIGLYGPRLGNRQQLPGGTTVLELASALVSRHGSAVVESVQLVRMGSGDAEEVALDASRILGREVTLPEPAGVDIDWLRATRLRVPGAAGVHAFAAVGPRINLDFVSVFMLLDEDRFTVFDRFGRPNPLPEGEMFSVGVPGSTPDAVLHVFRIRGVVFAVQSSNRAVADELVGAIEFEESQRAEEPREGAAES
jgi:hypothetical protein